MAAADDSSEGADSPAPRPPPDMGPDLPERARLRDRIRWGNVAWTAAALAAVGLALGWPRLASRPAAAPTPAGAPVPAAGPLPAPPPAPAAPPVTPGAEETPGPLAGGPARSKRGDG